jgi:FKBP-type peptidyl-prolyl cis-trans isomerase FkpA
MRNKFFFMLALPFLLAACNKSNSSGDCSYKPTTAVASAAEIATMKTWLDANSLTYTQHPSGLFYRIVTPGSGTVPGVCSDVTVKYIGKTTTSTTPFDQNTTGVTFTLGQLIAGWQIGIPLIQKGGSIILYIPPTLGYGSAGAGASIPPNSYLVFTIDLVNVQ